METLAPSLVAAIILAAIYALEGRMGGSTSERTWTRRRWISAAAGVSVAYIFVDVLPELAAQQKILVDSTGNLGLRFADERIYFLTLLAFVVFYGLDHIVLASRERRRGGAEETSTAIYRLHVSGFAAYSGLIGYLLLERSERGWLSLATYSVAMALHFLIVGHSLSEEHGLLYHQKGRWLLIASVFAGWLLSVTTHLSESVFAGLFAVLAGGVIITSLKDELPDDRKGRFWPFCGAAALFALVLLWSDAAST